MYLSPIFFEIWYTCSPHPYNKMFILRVNPLSWITVYCSFVLSSLISRPTYTCLIYRNWLSVISDRVAVIEISTREHTTWTSNCIWIKWHSTPTQTDIYLCICDIGRAYFCLLLSDSSACELFIAFRLNKKSLILIEILKLVHHINGRL